MLVAPAFREYSEFRVEADGLNAVLGSGDR
jgi:hypothetical protein